MEYKTKEYINGNNKARKEEQKGGRVCGVVREKTKVYRYKLLNENNGYKMMEGEQYEWHTRR